MSKLPISRPLTGFIDFIRGQGIVGLAIGLVIGTAIKSVVDSLVTNIVNPILGLILGGTDLSHKSVCLRSVKGVCSNSLTWGSFVGSLISFITIAAVVYFVFIGLGLDKLDLKDDKKTPIKK